MLTCLASIRAHISLLISSGAIPATLVGFTSLLFHLIRTQTVCSVIMCKFIQGFLNCGFYLIKRSMLGCDICIVCVVEDVSFIVEWLIVNVDGDITLSPGMPFFFNLL